MNHLIIGFGAAGANAAETLRNLDADCGITVLNGEPHLFYLRLDLEGLFHDKPLSQLTPRPPEYWAERRIHVIADRAAQLHPVRREVVCESGRTLSYDRLLIAAGTRPRSLAVPGCDLDGVHHYHTLGDALAIRAARDRVKRAVIVGGGILGLELAHAACAFGWQITLLVRGGHVGSPIADATASALVLDSLRRANVEVLFGEQVAAIEGDGRVRAVRTKSSRVRPCDFVGICIGVEPDTGFLRDSSLLVDGDLIVNDRMQTGIPEIFAAGDCAVVRSSDDRLIHCNTWNVASSQARAAAKNMWGAVTVWREDVLYNLDLLFDQPFAMIGPWDDRRLPGRTIHEFSAPGRFAALVTRDGVLESAFLLGDRSADRRLRKLIAARALLDDRLSESLISS